MEAVGLILAVVGILTKAIATADLVQSGLNLPSEYDSCCTKLEHTKIRLQKWHQAAKGHSMPPRVEELANKTMQKIEQLCGDIGRLRTRYETTTSSSPSVALARTNNDGNGGDSMRRSSNTGAAQPSMVTRIMWALWDKKVMEKLTSELDGFVRRLEELVPPVIPFTIIPVQSDGYNGPAPDQYSGRQQDQRQRLPQISGNDPRLIEYAPGQSGRDLARLYAPTPESEMSMWAYNVLSELRVLLDQQNPRRVKNFEGYVEEEIDPLAPAPPFQASCVGSETQPQLSRWDSAPAGPSSYAQNDDYGATSSAPRRHTEPVVPSQLSGGQERRTALAISVDRLSGRVAYLYGDRIIVNSVDLQSPELPTWVGEETLSAANEIVPKWEGICLSGAYVCAWGRYQKNKQKASAV